MNDPHGWQPVVRMNTDEALREAEAARACCDADPAAIRDEVRDALDQAIFALKIARARQYTMDDVNQERKSRGLPPL